ncbi:folate-binding protein YgfZ [Marinomonas sp. M1K-6]|uniref:Folate-binding protein YgfZ n=1 Tax=Marinomonas profundi TaxID=2726122 RepID=A0A847QY55_9GAMM|nr:folate-binding protein YgfZ [Marinomonas profundi]NLQ18958.1 folate-binding protein YgfZ [Marinomonas profundi]UDV02303.1 folate-binding protein YgfZ [Marinomonas profundi]
MTSLSNTVNAILQNEHVIAKQHHIGVLRVTGVDAKKFLQGQITCDIHKLTAENGLYGAICSVKGRIISNFYLLQDNADILMLMSKDLLDSTLSHLKKYAVFFKTELFNDKDHYQVYAKLTQSALDHAPESLAENLAVSQDKDTVKMTLCQYPLTIEWLIDRAENSATAEHNTALAGLSILSARPLISLDQSEQVLPQWLNMQRTGGISFTKGCYTGQEIVARMQYRGKSKKQLALATWQGQPSNAEDILDAQGKNIGQVLDVSAVEDTYFAQIILNIEPSDAQSLLLDKQVISLLPLPYQLDTKK